MSEDSRQLTLDHLWIITILALIWFFLSITPLPPNDLWWHMAAGRIMLHEGAWMSINRWAYTVPYDAFFALQSWLSELILYGIWKIGNVPLLALTRTLAITASYGLMAWHAWRRIQHGKAIALALILAILIGWNNWTLRPQTLAYVPATAFIVLLGEYLTNRISSRWLIALPVIMLLWVNMHGSFMVGIGLLGLAWIGTLITAIDTSAPTSATARTSLGPLTITGIVTGLATLAQPLGTGIFGYVRMTINHPLHSQWFIEWLPPDNTIDPINTGFWFFAMLLLLAVLMAYKKTQRPTATDLLWYAALAWLTIGGVRYAIWFGLLLIPLLAESLAPFIPQRPLPRLSRIATRTTGILLGILCLLLLPWFQPVQYLGSEVARLFASSGPYRYLLSSTTPVAATAWLRDNPIEGRFWADMSYTSYTIWELPDKQVFVDLRVELFPKDIWQDYFAIVRGDSQSVSLLDSWNITHLMLDTHWQESLYHVLQESPEWCTKYTSTRTVIVARCTR